MKHGCVVLADTYHPMLEAARGLLDTKFRTVVMVSSFESLLKASIKIRPDLIVADLTLSSPDGHNFLHKPDWRLEIFNIIILGVYSDIGIVENIMKAGVQGYVLKAATATDLLLAVDKVLSGKIYVSPLATSG